MALSGEALRAYVREQTAAKDPWTRIRELLDEIEKPGLAGCRVCGEMWEPPEDDLCGETFLLWQQTHFRPPGTYEKKLREWRVNKMIEKEWPAP